MLKPPRCMGFHMQMWALAACMTDKAHATTRMERIATMVTSEGN